MTDLPTSDISPGYSDETVAFVRELPARITDGDWHKKNKSRYQAVLRDPTRRLIKALREKYVQQLSPEVAGGSHQISMLKKNDYGQGGYYPHYWFAFYDPAAGSKIRSIQLFFSLMGLEDNCQFGLGMGHSCEEYLSRLQACLLENASVICDHLATASPGVTIRIKVQDEEHSWPVAEWASLLKKDPSKTIGLDQPVSEISIRRGFSLAELPARDSSLVEDVGKFYQWLWPYFEASCTGKWIAQNKPTDSDDTEVDECVAESLHELAEQTSLDEEFLSELEETLLAKRQVVLVGPPGTSKTFVAQHFSRYFVRQREGHKQGQWNVVYMHASWAYEDFFEGIRPAEKEGRLIFERRSGVLLDWLSKKIKGCDPSARHVLVLDELNRCDTAAVLGELLQLLEYRGTTVSLLSGRPFVFPTNVYVIGTMNSADRSIGRLDLALRRRFLWLNLHSQPKTLGRWLDRPGNNPVGFSSGHLAAANEILSKRGIPPEQHVGHALFMGQQVTGEGNDAEAKDLPLDGRQLRRVVRYSVLPYVAELITTHFGRLDSDLLNELEACLMQCVSGGSVEDAGIQ